ncbi:MAG: YihY/virulence factor BrkB family protein [Microthrixaceae bacterium]
MAHDAPDDGASPGGGQARNAFAADEPPEDLDRTARDEVIDEPGKKPGEGTSGEDDEPNEPNLIDRTIDQVDSIQRRVPPFAVAHGVLKKYGEDLGGQAAMMLSYRSLFSIFPLLIAFVNIVGLILADNAELRDDLIDSTLAAVPAVGDEIRSATEGSGGSWWVIIASGLVSIWAGLGLLEVLQEALNNVWGVPRFDRRPWILRRLTAFPGAFLIGACLVLSGSATWIFNDADLPVLQRFFGYLMPVLAGGLCYLGLHALLCVRKVPFVWQLPGAVFAGVSWLVLQVIGTWFINRYVLQSSDTYGVFVVVLALLSWSYLLGTLYLYANELSSVLYDHAWPRSLSGRNLTDADLEMNQKVVERASRIRETEIDIDVPRLPR